MVIYMFRGPVGVTIKPMILAEIFRSLSLWSKRYDHFRGSNLLLQIWVLQHFYQRQAYNGVEGDLRNKIRSHAMRLSMWTPKRWRVAPFPDPPHRESYSWVTTMGPWLSFVKNQPELFHWANWVGRLVGVLRQFGMTQGVSQWSNMALATRRGRSWGKNPDPKDRCLVREWYNILDLDMGFESWCNP